MQQRPLASKNPPENPAPFLNGERTVNRVVGNRHGFLRDEFDGPDVHVVPELDPLAATQDRRMFIRMALVKGS